MTNLKNRIPFSTDARPWLDYAAAADETSVRRAIAARHPETRELAVLLSPAAAPCLEAMARQALELTRRHFGRTISLYVPLYLSNYCSGGCLYCGFSSDRPQPRRRLEFEEVREEIGALRDRGFQDVLLLTGARTSQADFKYLRDCVALAAARLHNVTVESFAMTTEEYRALSKAGCTGMTLYQETYDPALYAELHRWGEKRNYLFRFGAPERALSAGMRTVGMGVLLGLHEALADLICLYQHVRYIMKHCWKGGVSISFPRICSLASRTTVGGYHHGSETGGQFDVSDTRDVETFCGMLRGKGLEPVFKNWDAVFQGVSESLSTAF